jgi:hypothetical protein
MSNAYPEIAQKKKKKKVFKSTQNQMPSIERKKIRIRNPTRKAQKKEEEKMSKNIIKQTHNTH